MNMRNREQKKQQESWQISFSLLNIGSEDMPIEDYVQMAGEEIVDVEYNMVELVDLAWGKKIN